MNITEFTTRSDQQDLFFGGMSFIMKEPGEDIKEIEVTMKCFQK